MTVEAGKDRTAAEEFQYVEGDTNIANYAISGMIGSPDLKFLGVTQDTAASEKLAADYSPADAGTADQ